MRSSISEQRKTLLEDSQMSSRHAPSLKGVGVPGRRRTRRHTKRHTHKIA